jgi:predicted ATPase/class 3 adenylate cyclase/Tfp pilus assembly protein PilF
MPEAPTGTVTFLFTDIEGSTRLWQEQARQMKAALARHDEILRSTIEDHGGYVFTTAGDAFSAAFQSADDAIRAAIAAQRRACAEPWAVGALPVRMALHSGQADERDGDYFGPALNRCARLLGVGNGGQILLSAATEQLLRDSLPEEAGLADVGEHRLRDLARPERLFQVLHRDLPAEFPPLRSLDVFRHNLPMQLTSFVGRDQELIEVQTLLRGSRMVTLTGVGGSGKTRLALQVAADELDEFPDGVWLVELAAVTDPDQVAQTVVTALGLSEQPGRPIVETLFDHLASKSLLLVMDNCEHVLDTSAELMERLLRSAPDLRVLVTSREILGVAGEVPYQVRPLGVPDASVDRVDVLRFAAVRLFVERAEEANPSFRLSAENAHAISQISRRLDGMPLALELAAARVRGLSPEQIAVRLDDRFRLLTGGRRTALPRHQTLRATMDWSYELLEERERVLFERLSAFRGGFNLDAAEAVCSATPLEQNSVLDLLLSLVDKSLVVAGDPSAEVRYRLLETVRQFGRDRLTDSGQSDEVRLRHAEWFLDLAERAYPELGRPQQDVWYGRLDAEHDNLRAALEWSLEVDRPETALRIAGSLGWFWGSEGYLTEGRRWAEAALDAETRGPPTAARAGALWTTGLLATFQGDLERGETALEESVAISKQADDPIGTARALIYLGLNARHQGHYERSRRLLEESLSLLVGTAFEWHTASAYLHLAALARYEGDYDQARALHEQGLLRSRQLGHRQGVTLHRGGLGIVALRRGDYEQAESLFGTALKEHSLDQVEIQCLVGLGEVALEQGELERAESRLRVATTRARDLAASMDTEWALDVWARLFSATADPERAVRLYGTVAASRERRGQQIPPDVRRVTEPLLAELRATLGEHTYERLWNEGATTSLTEAVAQLLEKYETE